MPLNPGQCGAKKQGQPCHISVIRLPLSKAYKAVFLQENLLCCFCCITEEEVSKWCVVHTLNVLFQHVWLCIEINRSKYAVLTDQDIFSLMNAFIRSSCTEVAFASSIFAS